MGESTLTVILTGKRPFFYFYLDCSLQESDGETEVNAAKDLNIDRSFCESGNASSTNLLSTAQAGDAGGAAGEVLEVCTAVGESEADFGGNAKMFSE